MSSKPEHVHVTYIKTTPERLWQALTDGSVTSRYYFGTVVKSDWKPGSQYRFTDANGKVHIEGEVVEADRPRKLVTTFKATWDDEVSKDKPTVATFEIQPMGDVCKLTVIHSGFDGETATFHQVTGGWPLLTASLKSLLETGEALSTSQPQQAHV
jgi:uncharacterized protein YndB with AHSA1/START domain